MTKNWIVVPPPGISFDAKTGNILLESGTILSEVWIDQRKRFHIHLSNTNTIFISDTRKNIGTGWDGNEGHMGDIIWLSDEGGTLEYQKYRHEFLREQGEKISIKIIMLEGEVIPLPMPPVKSRWEKMTDALNDFFNPWPQKTKT